MSFGFSAVNAGQRGATVEPKLVAVSTEGSFRVTAPVSKILGIASGDYIMFLSNVDQIDAAITIKLPEIVEFCEEAGLEVGSPEAMIALHKEFDRWAIAKGIVEYDAKGNIKTMTERLGKTDKVKYASANFEEFLKRALEVAPDEVKDALTREGVTKAEQIEILSAFVTPRELPKFKGSKSANTSGLSGIGVPLNFTDSNVWKQLKVDMGDDATKLNREFSVDIDNIQDVSIYDGYKEVMVKALVLGDYVDKEPARIGKNDSAFGANE